MTTDQDDRIVAFVRAVTAAMGLPLEVAMEQLPDARRVTLSGEGSESLLQRRGEALDALQHIVNVVFRSEQPGSRIVVDCLDFRKAKDAELREMARFLAERARSTGEPQEIGPLNPYARRIVHLAVAGESEVTSESIGDAFLKTVIISPSKRR